MSPKKKATITMNLPSNLPEDVKQRLTGKFWTTSSLSRIPSSTFGTSPKGKEKVKFDDGYEVTRSSTKWVAIDKHNVSHARVRVEAMFGRLEDTPAPGHYSPKIDLMSKRETIAPLISISTRPADPYFDELKDLQTTRIAISLLDNPLERERKKKKKIKTYRITPGDLADVNIEDMKQGRFNDG